MLYASRTWSSMLLGTNFVPLGAPPRPKARANCLYREPKDKENLYYTHTIVFLYDLFVAMTPQNAAGKLGSTPGRRADGRAGAGGTDMGETTLEGKAATKKCES